VREATIERLTMMFAAELACTSDVDRRRILIALEAVTDFESWGRLRSDHGLNVEQARALWTMVVDRLLPRTVDKRGGRPRHASAGRAAGVRKREGARFLVRVE
jgi:hypothetical protein